MRQFAKSMNLYRGLLVIVVISVCSLFLRSTYAYFVKSASSTGNTFTAAEVFPSTTGNPTATPTGEEPTTTSSPTSPPLATPTPTVGPGDVVINEINWGGSTASTADEWLELKNTTGNSINLTNWVVEHLGTGTSNITIPTGIIGPNGFFLIANYPKNSSIINIDPDFDYTDVSLDNNGEQLVLKNNTGTIIDSANGLSTWFKGTNAVPQKSMERNNPPSDGTVGANWHTATLSINLDAGATESASPKADNS